MSAPLGFLSDSFADDMLMAMFAGDASKLVPEFEVGLSLEIPIDGTGTGLIEPNDPVYERVVLPADPASWSSLGVGSRKIATAVNVTFAKATEDWGQIQCYVLYDSSSRFLGFGLTKPFTILTDMTPQLSIGTVVIELPKFATL